MRLTTTSQRVNSVTVLNVNLEITNELHLNNIMHEFEFISLTH